MVRAGGGGSYVEEFLADNFVALGWKVPPVLASESDASVEVKFAKAFPLAKLGSRRVWASQVKRFVREVAVGDAVMTYDPERRLYFTGRVVSAVEWREHSLPCFRRVEWTHQVERDTLTLEARNSLGSIATFFCPTVRKELTEKAVPIGSSTEPASLPQSAPSVSPVVIEDEHELLEDFEARSLEFIGDRLARLDWKQFQNIVAAILRAMGYKTRVAGDGPDRGVDIFASPNGLGLQEPRVFVEVKHRKGQIGAPEIRSFLGGRKGGDRCLYVSSGGFTKDAKYEGDRSNIPLSLIDLVELRQLLLDHYDALDAEGRALIPLKRVYWPVD